MGPVVFSEGDVGCPPARMRGVSLPLEISSREKGKGWTVRPSGFGNIAPWWRVPFRVVARRETESPGRNYDLRAPVRPQVKQEASTPWFLHSSRRFDASKQRVSSWAVVNRDGYWTDHAHAGEEEGSSIRHPQAPRRTTSPWLGGPMRSDREPRFGSHGSTVPLFPWFRKQHSDSHLFRARSGSASGLSPRPATSPRVWLLGPGVDDAHT